MPEFLFIQRPPEQTSWEFGFPCDGTNSLRKEKKMGKALSWIGWYTLAVLVTLVLMPGISYAIVVLVERTLGIARYGSFGMNLLIALPVLLTGLYWMGWPAVRQRRFGRGHSIHAFGKAPQPTQRLCVRGPYQHSQNPMYFGWLTVMAGVGLVLGSATFVVLVPIMWVIFLYWYLPRFEWPGLRERFGKEWEAWKARTPLILPQPWRSNR